VDIGFLGQLTDNGAGPNFTSSWVFESAATPAETRPDTVNGLSVSSLFRFANPGVYRYPLTVSDPTGNSGVASTVNDDLPAYLVIYDPIGWFVTGGGWIWSPPGAFHPDLVESAGITGKAAFGFVAKYQKGANILTGNTEFQFKAGNLNLAGTSYQ